MALTKQFKLTLAGIGVVVLAGFVYLANSKGWLDTTKLKESTQVDKFNLPKSQLTDANTDLTRIPDPSNTPATIDGIAWIMGVMPWNAQMPIMLANGGPETTEGSLLEKYNVKLQLVRQNNCMTGQTELIKFARAYKDDPNTTEGYRFYNIMGDYLPSFVAGVNSQLADLGPEYVAVGLPYSVGKSYGEDALWGPKEWLTNKKSMIGSVIVTVPFDGDWNILVQLCMSNNLKFNWNNGTYDPDAVNVWAVDDFIKAGEVMISGLTAEWPVVKNGKRAGTKTVKPDGFCSWTPVDVNVAEAKGGLFRIVSTKDYDSQMPNIMVTIKKFADDNRPQILNMLMGFAEAGDQIKTFPDALKKASEVSQKVYDEQTPSFWMSLYKGRKQEDAQGNMVEVGGSKVMNLADNLEMFGRNDGSINVYKKVYETFGNIIVKNYPENMSSLVPYSKVMDLTILDDLRDKIEGSDNVGQFATKADAPDFTEEKEINNVVSSASFQINFKTNSAEFTPEAKEQLERILSDALIANELRIKINGHTDNVGNPDANMDLSERRANAVKNWLNKQAPNKFRDNKVTTQAYGQTKPIASNETDAGRSKNRRVEIIMGRAN